MATQEERRTGTITRLIEAGAEVLVNDGNAGFSTAAVAKAAGVSNGALFRHFPTRLDLLVASTELLMERMRHVFAEEFTRLGEGPKLRHILQALWTCVDRNELLAITEITALTRTDADLQERFTPILAAHHEKISELIRLARPADLEPERAEQLGFLFIYALSGLSSENRVGVGLGRHEEFITLGEEMIELYRAVGPMNEQAIDEQENAS